MGGWKAPPPGGAAANGDTAEHGGGDRARRAEAWREPRARQEGNRRAQGRQPTGNDAATGATRGRGNGRGRGARGAHPLQAPKYTAVYTSVMVFGRQRVENPLPYYLTGEKFTDVKERVYNWIAPVHVCIYIRTDIQTYNLYKRKAPDRPRAHDRPRAEARQRGDRLSAESRATARGRFGGERAGGGFMFV